MDETLVVEKKNGTSISLTVEHHSDHLILKGNNKNTKIYVLSEEKFNDYESMIEGIYKKKADAAKSNNKLTSLIRAIKDYI